MAKINTWYAAKAAANPEFARAAELVDLEQNLADLIVDLRVSAGLTQAALAALAGTTQATVSLIENGEANPRLATVGKLLQSLVSYSRSSNSPRYGVSADFSGVFLPAVSAKMRTSQFMLPEDHSIIGDVDAVTWEAVASSHRATPAASASPFAFAA